MNILKNINFERVIARRQAKHALKLKNSRRVPKLESARVFNEDGSMTKLRPRQPTVLKRATARSLKYLEDHGLATFKGCFLVVAAKNVILGNGAVLDLVGVPHYGV